MTIILALCIPLAFVAGGFVAYKGVQLGLRWQVQASKQEEPKMSNPIQPIVEARQEKVFQKQEAEQKSILHEYLNGADE